MPSKFNTFKLGAKMPLVPGFGENSVQRERTWAAFPTFEAPSSNAKPRRSPAFFDLVNPAESGFRMKAGVPGAMKLATGRSQPTSDQLTSMEQAAKTGT